MTTDKEEEFRKAIFALTDQLEELSELVKPLAGVNPSQVSSLPQSSLKQFNCSLVYTIHAMFWMYFKTLGQNSKTQTAKKELDKVQAYYRKIKELEGKNEEERPSIQLDKVAANKLIKNELGGQAALLPSPSQRQKTSPQKRKGDNLQNLQSPKKVKRK